VRFVSEWRQKQRNVSIAEVKLADAWGHLCREAMYKCAILLLDFLS
jgi:hypothetical protein